MLDNEDRQVLGDAAHQLHRVAGLGRAHARRRFVEAEELGFGRQRDADLEIALLAVRKIGGKLVPLAREADRLQCRVGFFDDVAVCAVMG